MDILSYVVALIQTHKEVGIPHLGTFFKKKTPGRYDAEAHSFLPPSYKLHFKTALTENTLLLEYICKQNQLSSESAQYHLDKFAEDIHRQLGETQQADLKSLGKLQSVNGLLEFEANPGLNLGYEFYGLPSVQEADRPVVQAADPVIEEIPLQPLQEESAKETISPITVPDPEKLEAIVTENRLEEENPPVYPQQDIYLPKEDTSPDMEEQKKGLPGYVKVTMAILVLLILLLGLFLWKPEWKDNLVGTKESAVANDQPVTVPDTVGEQTLDSLTQDTALTDTISSTTVPVDQLSTDTTKTKASAAPVSIGKNMPVTYEIIGSSVYGEKEAASFIAAMKKKWGINAKIVSQRPGKKIKISIATYKDEKTARSERNRLEEKINIPGLYIYVNTHKPE